eukprot:SAG11_NODE_24640_length_370_cov_0.955720_1_plen_80_part_10
MVKEWFDEDEDAASKVVDEGPAAAPTATAASSKQAVENYARSNDSLPQGSDSVSDAIDKLRRELADERARGDAAERMAAQ